jgi:hypothetical protein
MKEIPLTQEKFALVDDEDYEFLMQWKWYFEGRYARATNKQILPIKSKYMHRLIMRNIALNGESIDHINGDKMDNRKSNLRVCDKSKNMMNKGALKNNKSGFKGVHFDKTRGKYKVSIGFDGKTKCIGRYDDIIEAARAYNEAALKYHGEFAHLNDV